MSTFSHKELGVGYTQTQIPPKDKINVEEN